MGTVLNQGTVKMRWIGTLLFVGMTITTAVWAESMGPVSQRYAEGGAARSNGEVPDFQRHISPLFGKLGCNGRACHGSFQGQGGFRLSLFGYDLTEDYKSLTNADSPRIDKEVPESSLVLMKPMLLCRHKGGRLITEGSWEHELLLRWLEEGGKPANNPPQKLVKLEIQPKEIRFSTKQEKAPLKAIAHWKDGTSEDVTPLCRFTSRDTSVAKVDLEGVVTCEEAGDTHIIVAYDNGVTPVPVLLPYRPAQPSDYVAVPTPTEIDRLVLAKQKELGIIPSELCTDAEFLRRVSLDLTGTLPAPSEVEAFLADPSADKRSRKIDELLERPAYAAWWATRFSDMTGNNFAKIIERQASRPLSQQWYDWIRVRVEQNVPYDQIVKGIMLGTSRRPGEDYASYQTRMASYNKKEEPADYSGEPTLPQYWFRQNMRNADDRAMAVAHNFLGMRIQCAQCHKHPFDQWTQEEFKQFSAFFKPIQNVGTMADARQTYRDLRQSFKGNQKLEAEMIAKGETFPWQEVYFAGAGQGQGGGKKGKEADKPAPKKAMEAVKKTEPKESGTPAKSEGEPKDEKKSENVKETETSSSPSDQEDDATAEKSGEKPSQSETVESKDTKNEAAAEKSEGAKKSAEMTPEQKAAAEKKKKQEARKLARQQQKKQEKGTPKPPVETGTLPGSEPVELKRDQDPRELVVAWMLDRKNPALSRALVNRIWGWHLGVGIVDPVDDLSLGNPPSNEALLNYLTDEFIAHEFDLKWLHREILNSRTYQLSWKTNETNVHDGRNFSHALPRRLPAEVAYDAVQQALKSTKILDEVEEDLKLRSILSTNGQNAAGRANYALMVFGRPVRLTNCDCERSTDPSLLQTIYLHNDQELLKSLGESGWMQELTRNLAGEAATDEVSTDLQKRLNKLNGKLSTANQDLKSARQKKDTEAAAKAKAEQKRLQKEIAELNRKISGQKRLAQIGPDKVSDEMKRNLVRESYLRTLSRPPTDEETTRCVAHLSDGDDFVGNLRDMMWALLNTKEFIVNH